MQDDGGWIYVSNSEQPVTGGGVGAVRFDAAGRVVDAYPVLTGTNNNCAGGPTPWGTWLSCEENFFGFVYECDPTGENLPIRLAAMGQFAHEAAAVDPVGQRIYLTEDQGDGAFYRYTPTSWPDLLVGTLEVAVVDPAKVRTSPWAGDPRRLRAVRR
jgi:secreted PhoX family phosphatase